MIRLSAILLLFLTGVNCKGCGYLSCPKPSIEKGILNIHLVAHSHDDVGWLKTVDQYYYGSKKERDGAGAGVQYVLDSVIQALLHDPAKRFIFVEMAYFWRWWHQQSDDIRHIVRRLVNDGQLEFIGGGWSMNDEATAHYSAIIDQMSLGFRILNETFGKCGRPRIAWQIDPFGHTREQANLFAKMGFDGLFFGRHDYQDNVLRGKKRSLEMIWNVGSDGGKLFTGVLPNLYHAPDGFCFDTFCSDDPIMDDVKLEDNNVDEKVKAFFDAARKQAKRYATNNIMMTMGGDFQYKAAGVNFKNLDKLIYHVNQAADLHLNLFYSTPSCYLMSLNNVNRIWSTKDDDFIPYASDPHAYWTGFYSSRPSLKGMIRKANNILQICKQVHVSNIFKAGHDGNINVLRRAMAVAQHHDAVTGTAKQAVTNDYARRLSDGIKECEKIVSSYYGPSYNSWRFCDLLNITVCSISEQNQKFMVRVYNPISRNISKYIRIPVVHSDYAVKTSDGTQLKVQIIPISEQIIAIPGRVSQAKYELIYKAFNIPAVGYSTFEIFRSNTFRSINLRHISQVEFPNREVNTELGSGEIKLIIDPSGNISSVRGDLSVKQYFAYYIGNGGYNTRSIDRASGAYIFRPVKPIPTMLGHGETTIFRGPLVEEVHQIVSPWISHVVRLYSGHLHTEYEYLVGPIPIADGGGKEIISRFNITGRDIKWHGFFTDSNGRQMIKRIKNNRPTWKINITEPVSGNYYPITTSIALQNEDKEVSILTDRTQGGSSLNDGELELMVHRRLLYDDGFGVGEALNESAFGQGLVTRGKHILIMGPNRKSSADFQHRRFLSQEVFSEPLISFTPLLAAIPAGPPSLLSNSFHLPPNVNILTLEEWGREGSGIHLLLRLEHIFDVNESFIESRPVKVSIKDMFRQYRIVSQHEVTLGANYDFATSIKHRLHWATDFDNKVEKNFEKNKALNENVTSFVMNPMQIRTFIITVSSK